MNQDKSFFDRLLEIIAVLLLAVTTLGTAWCGYQASQWSGVQTDDNRIEAEHRLDGNREFGRAIQTISYDTNMVALYAQAVQAGNTGLVQFYRQSLFRPEFLPTLDKWEAQVAAGQAPTPWCRTRSTWTVCVRPTCRRRSRPTRQRRTRNRRVTIPSSTC